MKRLLTSLPLVAATTLLMATACSSENALTDVLADTSVSLDIAKDATEDVTAKDFINDTTRDITGDTVSDVTEDTGTDVAEDVVSDTVRDAQEDTTQPLLWKNLSPAFSWTVDETIGVSTHMRQSVPEDDRRTFEFQKYAELGSVSIREDYHWHHVEPLDDEWTTYNVQGQVDLAVANGVEILPMFGYQIDWAMGDTGSYSTIDMEEYGEYVGWVAETYCEQIKEYEIWNEENIPRFWKPAPDPEGYGRMLKAAHTAIKAACPDARVSFGGIASYDAETDVSDRYGFLERVWQAHPDICDYFEILAFHPYTFMQYDSPERDVLVSTELEFQSQSAQTDIVKSILAKMGCPDKSLMITEQGWPSYDLTEEQTGRFLPRSLLLSIRDGVEKWFWYTFWDSTPITTGIRPHEHYFGLFGWVGEDGMTRRAKPTWTALKAASDIIGDLKFARDISAALDMPNDVYALAFVDDSNGIVVTAWDGRDMPDQTWGIDEPGGEDTTYEMTLPLPDGISDIVVYDIFNNELVKGTDYTISETTPAEVTITLTPSVVYLSLVNPF